MSHQPERKEKNCLNCGTTVAGRYCQTCGQENIVTHQSFWSLTKHFVYDVLHFDGKFYHTLLYIFSRPGFVPRQYIEGKRVSYLDPIRMYLFTSAVFFLVFFSFDFNFGQNYLPGDLDNEDRLELAQNYQRQLQKGRGDTVLLRRRIAALLDTTKSINLDSLGARMNVVNFDDQEYSSVAEYDSLQKLATEKDGWFKRRMVRQAIKINDKYGKSREGANTFLSAFLHKLPYLLFVSLPFFALLLKLLYVRRKSFVYGDHAVFTFYHYIFSFILLLVIFGLDALADWTAFGLVRFVFAMALLTWPVYLFLEMKNFYGQRFFKTLVKFLVLNILAFLVMIILFIAFFVLSIFQA